MDERVRSKRESSERENCVLGEDAYPESTQVCAQDVCVMCEDGRWVELESSESEQ